MHPRAAPHSPASSPPVLVTREDCPGWTGPARLRWGVWSAKSAARSPSSFGCCFHSRSMTFTWRRPAESGPRRRGPSGTNSGVRASQGVRSHAATREGRWRRPAGRAEAVRPPGPRSGSRRPPACWELEGTECGVTLVPSPLPTLRATRPSVRADVRQTAGRGGLSPWGGWEPAEQTTADARGDFRGPRPRSGNRTPRDPPVQVRGSVPAQASFPGPQDALAAASLGLT